MNIIKHIKDFDLADAAESNKEKDVHELFDGPYIKLVEVKLRNGASLSKHKANEPITVFCFSGTGMFIAGVDLEDSVHLKAGSMITIEAGVEHEVVAEPALHFIITKFKASSRSSAGDPE